MSMEYIRETYKVPAKRGGRVEYTHTEPARMGTITGTKGARLRIKLDGDNHAGNYHPKWKLTYLTPNTIAQGREPSERPAGAEG